MINVLYLIFKCLCKKIDAIYIIFILDNIHTIYDLVWFYFYKCFYEIIMWKYI